jgi:hypothetical protein
VIVELISKFPELFLLGLLGNILFNAFTMLLVCKKKMVLGLCFSAVCFLFACGCGSSGNNGSGGDTDADPEIPARTYTTGQVVFGPLTGASVSVYTYPDLETALYSTITSESEILSEAGLSSSRKNS